jgi:hypothetical protein
MARIKNPIVDGLLGRLANPAEVAKYRDKVQQMLAEDEKRLKREAVATKLFWIFCAVSATAWLWFSADSAHLPRGPFLACLFFIWGGVEVVKQCIRSFRIDVLKEVKQLQLQVFELQQEKVGPSGGAAK